MDWRTKLQHPEEAPTGFQSLTSATHRASTTVLPNMPATANASWREPYSYGLYGTPTTLDLAQRMSALCGGSHTFITPSGQASIALVNLALLQSGDHLLVPENIYGNNADMAHAMLRHLGITTTIYDPLQPIAQHLQSNTRLVWIESPGSVTMEIADVPALVAEVHAHNAATRSARPAITVVDDTYSAGALFRPFDHGVDVTVQGLTKYIGGHSDVILGSVTLAPNGKGGAVWEALGSTHRLLGINASPDDCSLALRGLHTLDVRLAALARNTLQVAEWLAQQPQVERVLHPALSSCPGHATWKRDFSGAASIFSFVLKPEINGRAVDTAELARIVDSLQLFALGYSWGGTSSVVMAYPDSERVQRLYGGRLIRLGIGLEDPSDLIADLQQALSR